MGCYQHCCYHLSVTPHPHPTVRILSFRNGFWLVEDLATDIVPSRIGVFRNTFTGVKVSVKLFPVWWSPSWPCLNPLVGSGQPWGPRNSACLMLPTRATEPATEIFCLPPAVVEVSKRKQTAGAFSSLKTVHRNWFGMCLFMNLPVLVIESRTSWGPILSYIHTPCGWRNVCISSAW